MPSLRAENKRACGSLGRFSQVLDEMDAEALSCLLFDTTFNITQHGNVNMTKHLSLPLIYYAAFGLLDATKPYLFIFYGDKL